MNVNTLYLANGIFGNRVPLPQIERQGDNAGDPGRHPFIPPWECCLLYSLRPTSAMPAVDFGTRLTPCYNAHVHIRKLPATLLPVEPPHSLGYLFGLFSTGKTG